MADVVVLVDKAKHPTRHERAKRAWRHWVRRTETKETGASGTDVKPRLFQDAKDDAQDVLRQQCLWGDCFRCAQPGCALIGKLHVDKTYFNRHGLVCGVCFNEWRAEFV